MVLGILALLIVISLPLAINFYNTRSLDIYEQGIVQALRRSQLKAMAVENDSSFGVYITSTQYVLFKGGSYLGRDANFDEVSNLPKNLLISGLSEIVFSKLNGTTADTGTITLTVGEKVETININELGRINY